MKKVSMLQLILYNIFIFTNDYKILVQNVTKQYIIFNQNICQKKSTIIHIFQATDQTCIESCGHILHLGSKLSWGNSSETKNRFSDWYCGEWL